MMRKLLFVTAVVLALFVGLSLVVVPIQANPDYDPACDIDRNGEIDIVDIMRVAARWKKTGTWSCPCVSEQAPVPRTGQTECYKWSAREACTCGDANCPSGQDGDLEKGVAWPVPRFVDNSDGTVTDKLTGLIWLKNANCTDTVGGISKSGETLTWANALTWSNNLADGDCGLSDGSSAGEWRLPNLRELFSLIDFSQVNPAVPSGHPFTGVQSERYWSSTTFVNLMDTAWYVEVFYGIVSEGDKDYSNRVWPVRGGQ